MVGLLNLVLRQTVKIFRTDNTKYFNYFPVSWCSNNSAQSVTTEHEIVEILRKKFPDAVDIRVEDVSGGCGAMFDIYVETREFKGLSVVKQHRSVYDALKDKFQQIHGLHLATKAPP